MPASDPDAQLVAALLRSRVMHDTPESVVQQAINVFAARQRPTAAPQRSPMLRRLLAVLDFDSALHAPQAAALRALDPSHRTVLFCADGLDVDLRISSEAGGWRLSGQVLGTDDAGWVELQCGDFNARAPWNESTEFRLDGLPSGPWRMALQSDDWSVVLPDLTVPGEGG